MISSQVPLGDFHTPSYRIVTTGCASEELLFHAHVVVGDSQYCYSICFGRPRVITTDTEDNSSCNSINACCACSKAD